MESRKQSVRDGQLYFAQRLWGVFDSGGVTENPGPNYWSSDRTLVWADDDGLHLSATPHEVAGTNQWWCTQVYSQDVFGYGTYTFVVAQTDQPLTDSWITLGLFTYDWQGTYNYTELDVEFTNVNAPGQSNQADYNVWPGPGNSNRNPTLFGFDLTKRDSVHTITWDFGRVWDGQNPYDAGQASFKSRYAFSNVTKKQATYPAGQNYGVPVPQDGTRVYMNLWITPTLDPNNPNGPLVYPSPSTPPWYFTIRDFRYRPMGIVYGVAQDASGNGLLVRFNDPGRGSGESSTPAVTISTQWGSATQAVYGGDGVIYSVTNDGTGNLCWSQDAVGTGETGIAPPSPIGTGYWSQRPYVVYGGAGIIYGIDGSGAVYFYRDTNRNGTGSLQGTNIGQMNVLAKAFAGEDGVIYGVSSPTKHLLYFVDASRDGHAQGKCFQVTGDDNLDWTTFPWIFYGANNVFYGVDPSGNLHAFEVGPQGDQYTLLSSTLLGGGFATYGTNICYGGNGVIYALDGQNQLWLYRDESGNGGGPLTGPILVAIDTGNQASYTFKHLFFGNSHRVI